MGYDDFGNPDSKLSMVVELRKEFDDKMNTLINYCRKYGELPEIDESLHADFVDGTLHLMVDDEFVSIPVNAEPSSVRAQIDDIKGGLPENMDAIRKISTSLMFEDGHEDVLPEAVEMLYEDEVDDFDEASADSALFGYPTREALNSDLVALRQELRGALNTLVISCKAGDIPFVPGYDLAIDEDALGDPILHIYAHGASIVDGKKAALMILSLREDQHDAFIQQAITDTPNNPEYIRELIDGLTVVVIESK